MKQTNAFSAVRGGDALFPDDFGEDLLLFPKKGKYYIRKVLATTTTILRLSGFCLG